jgi:malonate decarboxylase beta subunit
MTAVPRHSYYEASARQRVAGLLDAGSFQECLGPVSRVTSPHLALLEMPAAFDDGVVVGSGRLQGETVLIAAQEGRFMGGAVGEVHGAKITGLLERTLRLSPRAVLLLLDSGGVRLHEANAGLIAVSEIMRALLTVRAAGIPCIALIGGAAGCFGGMGIVALCCDAIVMSEQGRLGLSGPEVIETAGGVEEFDARDRALVWRTFGGKHRYLLGDAHQLVADDIGAFRDAASTLLQPTPPLDLAAVEAEHAALSARWQQFHACNDALEVWQAMGIEEPGSLPLLDEQAFLRVAARAVRR